MGKKCIWQTEELPFPMKNNVMYSSIPSSSSFPGHTGKLHLQTPTNVTEFWNVTQKGQEVTSVAKAIKYLQTPAHFFFFTPEIKSHLLDDIVERWKQPET